MKRVLGVSLIFTPAMVMVCAVGYQAMGWRGVAISLAALGTAGLGFWLVIDSDEEGQ